MNLLLFAQRKPRMRFSLLLFPFLCAPIAAQTPLPKPKSELPSGGKIETSQPAMEVDEYGFPLVKSKKKAKKSQSNAGSGDTADLDAANLPVNEKGEANSYGAGLDPIVRRLRFGKAAERFKAATELGAMGEKAIPASRPLCDAVGEANDGVARAALAALELVRPDLHKHVSPMVLDGNYKLRYSGADALVLQRRFLWSTLLVLASSAFGVTRLRPAVSLPPPRRPADDRCLIPRPAVEQMDEHGPHLGHC